jgi:hypothetical protein
MEILKRSFDTVVLSGPVAVGCAEWEKLAVRPRLVDGTRERRPGKQSPSIRTDFGERAFDRVRPVGVEQCGCGRAIGKTERVGGRPLASLHLAVEPAIGGVEKRARFRHTVRVALVGRAKAVEHDLLHRRRDVVVEEAVHRAHVERATPILGHETHPPGMMHVEVLDDDARFDDRLARVQEHGHFL